jgi:hypothetical protein
MNRFAAAVLAALVGTALVPMGCGPLESDRLVVATTWSSADRLRIETGFAKWVAASVTAGRGTVRLDWLILAPGDDPARLAGRRNPPDVLLGGPASAFDRLARRNQLSPLPREGSPPWSVARRSWIRLTGPSPGPSGEPGQPGRDLPSIAIDDPRDDPISLAWAKGLVGGGQFREGYAQLVRVAGHRRRIGRQAGSARAAVERGEAALAPQAVTEKPADDGSQGDPWIEGVAILRGAPHPEQARLFLRFLAETGPARSVPRGSETSTDAEALLADLLGATLVDAQDELWTAWSALERAGYPETALRRMTEPPPWPPASVAKLMTGAGEHGMSMVETLAGELATEPPIRAWLVRSWLAPARLIDDAMLEELARAEGGGLCREPRFRDWLRAEWTAWARQRARRVARLAASSRQ